jgi:hypothetical protein
VYGHFSTPLPAGRQGNPPLRQAPKRYRKPYDESANIKRTDNYRNDRTTYKLNSGLFSDTTAQRFVLYFFADPHFLKTILASRTSGTFGFTRHTSQRFAKPKEPLFSQHTHLKT